MAQIAEWLAESIKHRNDDKILNKLSNEVKEFSRQFPLPSDKNE
jgi:glycine/serine hydroxymethyltransferase